MKAKLDLFTQQFWQVAVICPLKEPLTYLAPLPGSDDYVPIARGQRVQVPLGKRMGEGIVIGLCTDAKELAKLENITMKSIVSVDKDYAPLAEHFVCWLEWLASYYIFPLGMIVPMVFPPTKKATKAHHKSKKADVIPKSIGGCSSQKKPAHTLEQAACLRDIVVEQKFKTHLVFGVTGSGKTEIYLSLLERVLLVGKTGLVLVPEIALTPQLIQRFVERFGDRVAAMHSQLTSRERTNQWWDMVEGRKSILIGARSALFCPLPHLGIIVVDEEHEPSYKQDESLRYNGRDAAIMLAKLSECPIILGSATPSLESWKNAKEGRYYLHHLTRRVSDRPLPKIEIIDLRKEKERKNSGIEESESKGSSGPMATADGVVPPKVYVNKESAFWLSQTLREQMELTLARQDQVALFLNRRGMAQTILCPSCGHTVKCPNCEINLTLHGSTHLICHYCDYHENYKTKCPECHEGELTSYGIGTEMIENDLRRLFPDKRIGRMDRDEIQNRLDLEKLIEEMHCGDIDILIGTQMIAKGLDFPKLKLVGLVLADVGFNIPDFRATERSFHLITQMSGRSGRHVKDGEDPGQVFIQCFNTAHPSIQFAKEHDYLGFAEAELEMRQALSFPPCGKLIGFRIQGTKLHLVREVSDSLARRAVSLIQQVSVYQGKIEILGPSPSPLAKLRNKYRYHCLIKFADFRIGNQFVRQVLGDEGWVPREIKISVDVDPINLL